MHSTRSELQNLRENDPQAAASADQEEEFARILKETKAEWKDKNRKIKEDFKELLQEYEAL